LKITTPGTIPHTDDCALFMYRGENRLVGWEYRSVANVANRCLLRMIVSTDIKVSVFTGMATWYNIPHILTLVAVKIVCLMYYVHTFYFYNHYADSRLS